MAASIFDGLPPLPSIFQNRSAIPPPQQVTRPGMGYTPEGTIKDRRDQADKYWATPVVPHWTGVVAQGLAGLGSAVERGGADTAEKTNQTMRSDALMRAGEAKSVPDMASVLMQSGVPGLGETGLKSTIDYRTSKENRAAQFEQDKRMMQLRSANALEQARQMGPIETAQAIERAKAMQPLEIDRAKAIAETKSQLDIDEEIKKRKARADEAIAAGYDPKSKEFKQFVYGLKEAPGKTLSYGDITKLTEEGQKFADINRFATTFKPEYAGYGMGGQTSMSLTRAGLPVATSEAASWWQGYDRYKNVVRNELFGASLTAGETEAFEKADITPNMDPKIIARNLAAQKAILDQAMKKKAAALSAQGYDTEAVRQAYGASPGGAVSAGTGNAPRSGDVQDGYRFKGGNPADKSSWEAVR